MGVGVFKRLIVIFCGLWAFSVLAFAPHTGTWVVSNEVDGKPGRGMALDVQNNVIVMQMYAYESSGQPTFYLAVGTLTNNQFTAPVNRYEGGRFFGSAARSGTAMGSPGNLSMRFTSGTSGFVTFPGEPERAIQRFEFGYPFERASLQGIWSFNSLGSSSLTADVVSLTVPLAATSGGNGMMASSDGQFGCEHQTSGTLAGGVLCVRVNSQGNLQRSYFFKYSVNDGEGYMVPAGSSTNQFLAVRRLTTPSGIGTGIVYANGHTPAFDPTALTTRLTEAAMWANGQ